MREEEQRHMVLVWGDNRYSNKDGWFHNRRACLVLARLNEYDLKPHWINPVDSWLNDQSTCPSCKHYINFKGGAYAAKDESDD